MSSTYGDVLKLSIFGESHGNAIGMILDGIPSGLPVDIVELQTFLNRRAPGQTTYSTQRKEVDTPDFLSGIYNGYTSGAPISAIMHNTNMHSNDYAEIKDRPRPGHADYVAEIKYHGYQDIRGGGHFSGRLTASLCIAGGLCKQWLSRNNICIGAHIAAIGGIADAPKSLDWVNPDFSTINDDFPVVNHSAGEEMKNAIQKAKSDGDSIGGIIECIATGLPVGIGDPIFGGMESRIAQIVYGIPAVKGLDFGAGFTSAYLCGSQNNDSFIIEDNAVKTKTNNAGGILGGITTGMPLIFSVAFKPTPSIGKVQNTVSLSKHEECDITVLGRHDPCIVPRAVPVVEAAAAIAIFDAMLASGYYREVY